MAGDEAVEKPFRDLALIRQSIAEFDSVKPQVIIDRLKPLTDPNSPWLGTAGAVDSLAGLPWPGLLALPPVAFLVGWATAQATVRRWLHRLP